MISRRFIRLLFVALLFSAHTTMVWAEKLHEDAQQIAAQVADWLDPEHALFLDIRCGEWTNALSQSLRETLLERSFDLREVRGHQILGMYEGNSEALDLGMYGLESAVLVTIELNLKWQMVEHKSFLSYRSERVPVQSFVVKQTQLPQHQLLRIDNYDHLHSGTRDAGLSSPRLHWFEPLVVSTAVASIIFLLWTIE